MKFMHTEFYGGPANRAVVTIDRQCNVMLLDDCGFSAYRRGAAYRYSGGWHTKSPVTLTPPHDGHWHVIVDLGGCSGTVRASIRVT